jgi:hypothetical protein
MAQSLAHKFGQIMGNVIEDAMAPILRKFADEHSLYLDKKGPRAGREGMKVTWTDLHGNAHDLDFVLERGGTDAQIGTPVAFIESAWRRYTKHSRNKAQEIQGAIQVLALTYQHSCPFTGAILAGVFTDGAINQLKSLGFRILFFPYESIIDAFGVAGIDASFAERTPEKEFRKKLSQWKAASKKTRLAVANHLVERHSEDISRFLSGLHSTVTRCIERVILLPLHGREVECVSVREAITFLGSYEARHTEGPAYRYEIQIRYTNTDRITAEFRDKALALDFLRKYE